MGPSVLVWQPSTSPVSTDTKMSSFWRHFQHWLLPKWQLPVQSVMKMFVNMTAFPFQCLYSVMQSDCRQFPACIIVMSGVWLSSLSEWQPSISVSKIRKNIYRSDKSFTAIVDVHSSFIPNKTTFTKYCLTRWISKSPRSFEIHRVRQ